MDFQDFCGKACQSLISLQTAMHKTIFILLLLFCTTQAIGQAELKDYFDNGVKYLKAEKYQEADSTFTDVLHKATDSKLKEYCYIYRGMSYRARGDYKKAIADFDRAIKQEPSDLASYADRAITKLYAKDNAGAIKDYEYIVKKDSVGKQGQSAMNYLARIHYEQKEYDQSIKYYDRLIKINPNDPELYFNRGAAKGMLLQNKESIVDYDKAIALKPDYKEAYANRGVAKINLLTSSGTISPTSEQASDGCADLQKAKQLGDNDIDDLIFAYCHKK